MTVGRREGRALAVVPDSSLRVPVRTAPRTIIEAILCRIIVLPFQRSVTTSSCRFVASRSVISKNSAASIPPSTE
jgi:hypothetical protein